VTKFLLKFVSLLWCSALLSQMVWAASLSQADLIDLFGEDFSAKQLTISKIVQSPPELASKILFALQDENVFMTQQHLVVIKNQNTYINPIDNTETQVEESSLETPSFNNSIRSDIESAVSQFKLLSPDFKIRAEAIETLSSDLGQIQPSLVKKAFESETDTKLKNHLESLDAMLKFKDADTSTKLQLLKLLSHSQLLSVEKFLLSVSGLESSGNFLEADKNIREAAELALKDFRSRKFHAELVSNIFTGLSLGSVLLLAALGLAITYGLIGVINMAHGEFLMIGAYATFIVQTIFRSYLVQYQDFYLIFAVPFSFLCSGIFGLILEKLVLRHLYGRPLETLLATFGISLLIMQTVRVLFGAQNVEVGNPTWMSGSFSPLQDFFPGLLIPYNRLIIFFFSLSVVAITWGVLNKTRMGLFVRAVTQNRAMASCVGVKTRKVDSYAFAFGAGIAGLGGCALSQIGNVGPDLGQSYIIDSFMVVVLGGVGQIAGTIIGSFGLGVLSKFSEPLIGAVLTKIAVLVIIILFIQKRPQGMFALKGRSSEA
jgi:urea transport system permease protein